MCIETSKAVCKINISSYRMQFMMVVIMYSGGITVTQHTRLIGGAGVAMQLTTP